MCAGTLLTGVIAVAPAESAQALIAGEPTAVYVYYVDHVAGTALSSGSTMYDAGCDDGTRSVNANENIGVILDFGAQVAGGTRTVDGSNVAYSWITAASKAFAYGFYKCSGYSKLELAIGTNNSGSYNVNANGGSVWASETQNVMNATTGYAAQVSILGASDMEPGYATASVTRSWVDGYMGRSGRPAFWSYSSANGCSIYSDKACDNGWTKDDLHYVSWTGSAYPVPQIYNDTNAKQWNSISNVSGYMTFRGSLSQHSACAQRGYACSGTNFTSTESWEALNAATGQQPPYSMNIRYTNG